MRKLIPWCSTVFVCALLFSTVTAAEAAAQNNAGRSPSQTVIEFYKAMREHRFKEAWALTIYKSAVVDLTADEMEDLRVDFEDKAAQIPEKVEIASELIKGNNATVYVVVPATESTPQVTSQPVTLISSGGFWIIGDETNLDIVKKAGRRFFLDALISEHQGDVEDLLKRLIAVQIVYSAQHNGFFGDLPALIATGLVAKEAGDPKSIGYNVRIIVAKDGKSYVASAEPTRYGRTGKLSFWMDQTGAIKSLDTKGLPLNPSSANVKSMPAVPDTIKVGMSSEQVQRIWGAPIRKRGKTTTAAGVTEWWDYPLQKVSLFFENDKLTIISERPSP
jgi:hypothetical protein